MNNYQICSKTKIIWKKIIFIESSINSRLFSTTTMIINIIKWIINRIRNTINLIKNSSRNWSNSRYIVIHIRTVHNRIIHNRCNRTTTTYNNRTTTTTTYNNRINRFIPVRLWITKYHLIDNIRLVVWIENNQHLGI